ncbi:MAG: hypothetical protein AAF840_07390, partial [Bacteroidota bacterium]
YKNDAPFGKRKNRDLPAVTENNNYDFQLATIEFLQHDEGILPSDLSGVNAEKINTYLTNAAVHAVAPPPPPDPPSQGGGGGLVLNVSPQTGGNSPGFTINGGGGIQPINAQFANAGGGNDNGGGGGGGIPNFPGPGGQYAAQLGFIPMVDFTEWVTYKDYILYRQLVDEGVFELADLSETMPNQSLDHVYNNSIYCDDDLELPNAPGYNNMDPDYNFYRRYYLPIRAYFHLEVNDGYFPYPARQSTEMQFKINNQFYNFQTPKLND